MIVWPHPSSQPGKPPLLLAPDEPEVLLDINTTPLTDGMLRLLIMPTITIPIQWHAVNMDTATSTPPPSTRPKVMEVDIDARNQMRWNAKPIADRDALQRLLQEAAQMQPQPEIHIRADGQTQYQAVAAVLAGAQREGLQKIGIVGTAKFAAP